MFFKRLRSRAAYRIGLTGTPMPHSPMDIYGPFRFLDITIFGPSFGRSGRSSRSWAATRRSRSPAFSTSTSWSG